MGRKNLQVLATEMALLTSAELHISDLGFTTGRCDSIAEDRAKSSLQAGSDGRQTSSPRGNPGL